VPRVLRPLLTALLAILAVLATLAGPGAAAPVPAPPPATFCRVPPPAGWPAIGAAGTVPDLTPWQDGRAGLGITGEAPGADIRIADVEYEWRASHAELAGLGLPASPVTPFHDSALAADHGTAVLGILGAAADGQGVTGLAAGATILPVPAWPAGGRYQPAEAIATAAAGLRPGDVLLVELQAIDADGRLVPIEMYPSVRDAIRSAVDAGIVVVEPAGNGGLDLATLTDLPWLAGRGHALDSGAIMVAAGGAGTDQAATADLRRVPASNYGARVDLQGYGAGVVTSGYGDAGGSGDRAYTACFDGTSSAAATVAAAVADLQSASVARDGRPLAPAAARDLLAATGRPQASADDGVIGPRPDVAAAVTALAAPAEPPAVTDASAPSAPPPASAPAARPPAATGAVASAAPPARAASPRARRRAASGVSARIDRRHAALTLRLRGLAARARVTVAGRRVAVRHGRIVLRGARRGTWLVRVSAPGRASVAYRVRLAARGAPRVTAG
jgi:hypothetical protein